MNSSVALLAVTLGMLAVFGVIVARTYRRKKKDQTERPKYRMLEDD